MNKTFLYLTFSVAIVLAAIVYLIRPDFLFPIPKKQNIIVILADTLRPDHLGVYGYARDTSPTIDAIADRGMVFTSAYSVCNWTNPAIKSIFTGLSPQAVMPAAWHREAIAMPLPEEVNTFAELTKAHGYRTAALVDHPGITPRLNFNQGFEEYVMLYAEGAGDRGNWGKSDVDYVTDQFGKQLDGFLADPFLIYLHVVYPHRPYEPPDPYRGMFGQDSFDGYVYTELEFMNNAYDAEVRRTDDLVGNLIEALDSRDLLEDTWVIFLSDHAEGFWEHGYAEHGNVFFNEIIRIPLVVVPPRGQQEKPLQVDTPVSNLDVFATVLDIAGVPLPGETSGFSLIANEISGGPNRARTLYSESAHSYDIEARTVIRDGFKYSNYPSRLAAYQHFLFDLSTDPLERENLYGTRPAIEAALHQMLADHKEQSQVDREWLAQKVVQPDERTIEALRSLGYTQ